MAALGNQLRAEQPQLVRNIALVAIGDQGNWYVIFGNWRLNAYKEPARQLGKENVYDSASLFSLRMADPCAGSG